MTEAPRILLDHHLKSLRLPTVLREYGKLARHCAAEGLDHVQFLARLVELEMIERERRMIARRVKAAQFPAVRSLDSFDFKAIPALNKMQVLELARLANGLIGARMSSPLARAAPARRISPSASGSPPARKVCPLASPPPQHWCMS